MAHLQNYYKPYNGSKRVGYKTRLELGQDHLVVTHHRTDVVTWSRDHQGNERIVINHDGWTTKTTAERINYALALCSDLSLLTRDLPGKWRIADTRGRAWTIRGRTLTLYRGVADSTWSRY